MPRTNTSAPTEWRRAISSPACRRVAWLTWAIFAIVVTVVVSTPGFGRTVTPCYHAGTERWWDGPPIYNDVQEDFLYLPHAAIAFTPVHALPFKWGEVTWRLFAIFTLAVAVRGLAHPSVSRLGLDAFLPFTLMVVPLAWNAARNGQATLPLAATMIAFALVLAGDRHWLAAIAGAIGLVFKPYMVVPILLAFGLVPAFRGRMLVTLLVFLATPFAFQTPDFVVDAYRHCFDTMRGNTVKPWSGTVFSDVFRLLHTAGLSMAPATQLVCRALAAVATLAFAGWVRRRWPNDTGGALYAIAALYLVLFSPRIENNTYALAGPAAAWIIVELWCSRRANLGWAALAVLVVMIAHRPIATAVLPVPPLWLLPLGALTLAGMLVAMVCFDLQGVDRPIVQSSHRPIAPSPSMDRLIDASMSRSAEDPITAAR